MYVDTVFSVITLGGEKEMFRVIDKGTDSEVSGGDTEYVCVFD